jgi:hypothetical protein
VHEVVPGKSAAATEIQSILAGEVVVSVRQVVHNHTLLAKVRQFTRAHVQEHNVRVCDRVLS